MIVPGININDIWKSTDIFILLSDLLEMIWLIDFSHPAARSAIKVKISQIKSWKNKIFFENKKTFLIFYFIFLVIWWRISIVVPNCIIWRFCSDFHRSLSHHAWKFLKGTNKVKASQFLFCRGVFSNNNFLTFFVLWKKITGAKEKS